MEQTTDPTGSSLEVAGQRIALKLSAQAEDPQTATTQPEQAPATEPTQVPAAPSPEASESATSATETAAPPTPDLRKLKVPLPDGETELPEDEVVKGYLRTADYTRKTQALAEEKKAFEQQEIANARARDQQYATYLAQLQQAIEEATPVEPQWETLRQQVTPEAFADQRLAWDQRVKQLATITAEREKTRERQEQDAAEGFAKFVQLEHAKLEDALPEFKDPETAKTRKAELREYAKTLGYDDDAVNQVVDHRLIVVLDKARRFDLAQKKAPDIKNKIEQAMDTSAPGSRTSAPKVNDLETAQKKLAASGRVEDAAAVFAKRFAGR